MGKSSKGTRKGVPRTRCQIPESRQAQLFKKQGVVLGLAITRPEKDLLGAGLTIYLFAKGEKGLQSEPITM